MARVVLRNSEEPDNSSSHKCFHSSLLNMLIIACYFCLSIALTFYQKKFIETYKFPLSIVVCHLVFKFIVALICRKIYEIRNHQKRVLLCWHNQLHKIAPTGIASGLDIGFSQWGLQLNAVSLYTMTKSTSVVFILIFSLVFQLEKKSWFVFVVVSMISGGLFMFTYEVEAFNWLAFSLLILASFSSGLRWTLAQFVMQRSDLNMNSPIDMVYHVQPWMVAAILPFAVVFEGPYVISSILQYQYISAELTLGLLEGAVLATSMEYTEYMVVSRTSSLTLSVVGIVKEVTTLALAVESEKKRLTPMKLVGLIICLTGVAFHIITKSYRQYRQISQSSASDSMKPLLLDETSARFLLTTSDENDSEDETEVLFNVLNSRER